MSSQWRKKQLSFSVDISLETQLRQAAGNADKSMDEFIEELVKAGLARRNVEQKIARALHSLTPREREVCIWVAQGYTNEQISTQLFISQETVKSHIRAIRQKLKLRSKSELRVYLMGLGISP